MYILKVIGLLLLAALGGAILYLLVRRAKEKGRTGKERFN